MKITKPVRILCRRVVFSTVLIASSANAENLLDIYESSLSADPQLQAAIYDHTAGAEVVTQAWAGYRPTVTLDYDHITTTQDIISSDNALFQQGSTSFPTTTWTLTVTQPIFRYANFKRIGQAKEELQQADAELVQAQQDLMMRVSEAYLAALSAEDEVSFLRSEKAAAAKQVELAQGRENAAVGRAVDRYDAEARLASVEADAAAAEVAMRDAYEALYEMMGREPMSLSPLKGEIDLQYPMPADDKHWIDAAMQNNPALVVQRYAVNVAKTEIARQNGGHFPTVDAVLRKNNRLTQGTLFGGGSEVGTQEMMIRLSVPIYSGGSVSSKKREAVALYQSAEQELTRVLRESRRQSRDAYWGVVNAVKRIKALTKAVDAQQATLDLRRASYDSGLQTAISVLDAERDFYSAKRDLAQAKYDYLLNSLRLKAMVGILTRDDLSFVNGWLQN
jgi:outer membrane protein